MPIFFGEQAVAAAIRRRARGSGGRARRIPRTIADGVRSRFSISLELFGKWKIEI